MQDRKEALYWISVKGAVDMIMRLLERPHYVSELWRSDINPKGIASPGNVGKMKGQFSKLGLIEEYEDEIRPRLYLRLTDRGRLVAEHLKAIEEILQSP